MLLSVDFTELGNAQNGGTSEIFVAFQLVTSAPHREENISWGWNDYQCSCSEISYVKRAPPHSRLLWTESPGLNFSPANYCFQGRCSN